MWYAKTSKPNILCKHVRLTLKLSQSFWAAEDRALVWILVSSWTETEKTDRVRSVQSMMSELRVETLNVLAPLCKKLQAITHHTVASQAKKGNRALLKSPQRKKKPHSSSFQMKHEPFRALLSPVPSSLPRLCLLCYFLSLLVVFSIFV